MHKTFDFWGMYACGMCPILEACDIVTYFNSCACAHRARNFFAAAYFKQLSHNIHMSTILYNKMRLTCILKKTLQSVDCRYYLHLFHKNCVSSSREHHDFSSIVYNNNYFFIHSCLFNNPVFFTRNILSK